MYVRLPFPIVIEGQTFALPLGPLPQGKLASTRCWLRAYSHKLSGLRKALNVALLVDRAPGNVWLIPNWSYLVQFDVVRFEKVRFGLAHHRTELLKAFRILCDDHSSFSFVLTLFFC